MGIEPTAIEHPLDLTVPENKMMLAFYLSIPEVENTRRALNIKQGIRKAKQEGRWMGTPPTYGTVSLSQLKIKYICAFKNKTQAWVKSRRLYIRKRFYLCITNI